MTTERAIGIVGWSGVGKTTLIERLVPSLSARGLRVSTVKHCHRDVMFDAPGKDSFRHQEAGAVQTMLVSPTGAAILERIRSETDSLDDLLARMSAVDVVLVEGFRSYGFPRLEVWDAVADRPPHAFADRSILAVISDSPLAAELDRARFGRGDIDAIADFIEALLPGLRRDETPARLASPG